MLNMSITCNNLSNNIIIYYQTKIILSNIQNNYRYDIIYLHKIIIILKIIV